MRTVKREFVNDSSEYALACVPSGVPLICPYTENERCGSACAAFQCKPPEDLPDEGVTAYYCQAMGGGKMGEEAEDE